MRLVHLAARNLMRNRRRTILCLLALVLGTALTLVTHGFFRGVATSNTVNIVEGQVGAIQIYKKGYLDGLEGLPLTLDFADAPELRQRLLAVSGVRAISGRILFGAMLSMPDKPDGRAGKTAYLTLIAMDPAGELEVVPRRFRTLGEGRPLKAPEGGELILSTEMAESVQGIVTPVDGPSPAPEASPVLLASDRDGALNGEGVELVGTWKNPFPGDRMLGFVPLGTAQRLLRMEGRVTQYVVAVNDLEQVAEVKARLQAAIGPGFDVLDYNESLPFVQDIHNTQHFFANAVSIVLMIIALLGVVNSLLMSVLERVREIGTLLAVGMRRAQIRGLLAAEAALLGVTGGAMGLVLGLFAVYVMSVVGIQLPAPGSTTTLRVEPSLSFQEPLWAYVGAVAVSVIAGWWPAVRASRLRPVEALAHR